MATARIYTAWACGIHLPVLSPHPVHEDNCRADIPCRCDIGAATSTEPTSCKPTTHRVPRSIACNARARFRNCARRSKSCAMRWRSSGGCCWRALHLLANNCSPRGQQCYLCGDGLHVAAATMAGDRIPIGFPCPMGEHARVDLRGARGVEENNTRTAPVPAETKQRSATVPKAAKERSHVLF